VDDADEDEAGDVVVACTKKCGMFERRLRKFDTFSLVDE
jgi:hypothetical protein